MTLAARSFGAIRASGSARSGGLNGCAWRCAFAVCARSLPSAIFLRLRRAGATGWDSRGRFRGFEAENSPFQPLDAVAQFPGTFIFELLRRFHHLAAQIAYPIRQLKRWQQIV